MDLTRSILQQSPVRSILSRMIKNLLAIYAKLDDPLREGPPDEIHRDPGVR